MLGEARRLRPFTTSVERHLPVKIYHSYPACVKYANLVLQNGEGTLVSFTSATFYFDRLGWNLHMPIA